MRKVYCLLFTAQAFAIACQQNPVRVDAGNDREQLINLERKWLEAEFSLDSAYLGTIIDTAFSGISETGIKSRQEEITAVYNKMKQRKEEGIVVDSFHLVNPIVRINQDNALLIFDVHSFGRDSAGLRERKTRFYDVWIRRAGKWKALASQGTPLE